jgi:hypothetical protein
MLPGWIIEQLEKNKETKDERPQLQLPIYDERPIEREEPDEYTDKRRVTIVDIAGGSED